LVPKWGIYWTKHRRLKSGRDIILPGLRGGYRRLGLMVVGEMGVSPWRYVSGVYRRMVLIPFRHVLF